MTARSPAHNLPATLAPMIGREAELERLIELPVAPSRLLTIVGPGGVGKTRLALDAAWAVQPALPDGAWWVPLAGVQTGADPALQVATVAGAIAAALEAMWPRPSPVLQPAQSQTLAWRFSGRWWQRDRMAAPDRPWR